MRKIALVLLVSLVASIGIINSSCARRSESKKSVVAAEAEGVQISYDQYCWSIINTNEEYVRIKKIGYGSSHAEYTLWIKKIARGEKIMEKEKNQYTFNAPWCGFYIYNMNGAEIGFISNYDLK